MGKLGPIRLNGVSAFFIASSIFSVKKNFMAFKKGHIKSPLSGVKLGQKTAPTLRREELRVKFQMMEDNIFNYAATLPPEKLTKFYLELKEYFDPKLSRVENKQEGPIVIKLDHLTDAEIKALENL